MSAATAPGATPPAAGRPYRMSFDLYWTIVASGALEAVPVFLWDGELIESRAPGRPHSVCVYKLKAALDRLAPAGYFVEQEQPFALSDRHAPEPDLKVVRGTIKDYPRFPPTAADVLLVVEVSDTTLAFDAGPKLRAYAAASIPVYWLVNLDERRIEAYSGPAGGSYQHRQLFGPDDSVPVILDGQEIGRVAVRDVLP